MPEATAREERAGRRVRRLLVAAVAAGALVLLGVSTATVFLVSDYQGSTQWVDHTYEVEHAVSDMRVNLSRAESARRGYLITGDSLFRRNFDDAATQLPQLEARFRALTADNPVQRANAERLHGLISRKLAEQQSSLQAIDGALRSPAQVATLVRENQATLDRLRDLLNGMMAEETRLLADRHAVQANEAHLLLAIVLASGAILALLAGGAFLLVRRYALDLGRSQGALRALNAGLEEEVARRTADLTRANEEIQRFAYIVSHDLRSPLVNVMGFTSELETAAKPLQAMISRLKAEAPQLLDRDAQAAVEMDLPESLGFIRTSTQKMDRLINAILRLSREGRRNLHPEALDMDGLIGGILASLKQQTEAKGATVAVEGELPDLVSDRLAVEQVFSNVVENALKYLKPGRSGRITVRGRTEGPLRVYEVEDNGRGIDPRDHERVFDLFRRAGVQDQPGEGIGLAHVRALVYRLGGAITVESELDRGATFRISLPRTLSPA